MTQAWTKLIAAAEIAAQVAETGARIARDYDCGGGEEIVLIGLLQGAVFFLADLARAIPAPVRIETLRPQSYGAEMKSSGRVALSDDHNVGDLEGRHVLVVDDVYDSGRTLRCVLDRLAAQKPKSLEVACLLVKEATRAAEVEVKYGVFAIPDQFVVGCGLDLAGLGRNLPDIWTLAAGVTEQEAMAAFRLQSGAMNLA